MTAKRGDFEKAGFEARYTPTKNDPNHHTIQLPNPVTPADEKRFNDVLKRGPKE